MIEIIMWAIAVFFGIGCALFFWELILNLKTVPRDQRPEFFLYPYIPPYQMYGGVSLVIVPLFGVYKWGWVGLFAYQIYPGACALLGIFFYLCSTFFSKGKNQKS